MSVINAESHKASIISAGCNKSQQILNLSARDHFSHLAFEKEKLFLFSPWNCEEILEYVRTNKKGQKLKKVS